MKRIIKYILFIIILSSLISLYLLGNSITLRAPDKTEISRDQNKVNVLDEELSNLEIPKYEITSNNKEFLFNYENHFLRNYVEKEQTEFNKPLIKGSGYGFFDNTMLEFFTKGILDKDSNGDDIDTGKRKLSLSVTNFSQNKKFVSKDLYSPYNLYLKSFNPDKCRLFSFIENTGDIFIICPSNSGVDNKDKFLVLGYKFTRDQAQPSNSTFLPIFIGYFDDEKIPEKLDSYGPIFNVFYDGDGKYFFVYQKKITKIEPAKDGKLVITKEFPIDVSSKSKNLRTAPYSKDISKLGYLVFANDDEAFVFDIKNEKFIPVDKPSCLGIGQDTSDNPLNPFVGNSYNILGFENLDNNHYRVTDVVKTASCVIEQGKTDVYITEDKVYCNVVMTMKTLDCSN